MQPAAPIHKRLLYTLTAAAIQKVLLPGVSTYRGVKERIYPPEIVPSAVKTFETRPGLPVRIFFPKSYDRSSPRPLPLLFSIHGGGHVLGNPSDNDSFNAQFSEEHSALVIALNYAKAPANPYPGQRQDLEAQIAAVFADAELTPHIDPAKVAVTGFSAGGNLALAVSEVPAVRERVTAGVVPFYPVLDYTVAHEDKAKTRRYKAKLGGSRGRQTDPLLMAAPVFDWAYLPTGQDLRDPLCAPVFANRSDLPKRVWVIGCELDMLGHEAWRAACRYAGKPVPGLDQPVGQEEPADGGKLGTLIWEGDERFAFDVKDQDGEVRWLLVPDAGHGFEMAGHMGGNEDEAKDGKLKMDALIAEMGKWLYGQ
ncbi:unnamed protein product [Discula destructiva]